MLTSKDQEEMIEFISRKIADQEAQLEKIEKETDWCQCFGSHGK